MSAVIVNLQSSMCRILYKVRVEMQKRRWRCILLRWVGTPGNTPTFLVSLSTVLVNQEQLELVVSSAARNQEA